MNPTIKAEWQAKLRQKKYRKVRGKLRLKKSFLHRSSYCAFGLLCEVAREHGLGHWERTSRGDKHLTFVAENGSSGFCCPYSIKLWAEITDKDKIEKIYDANDIEGKSFKQIADLLEAY